MPGQWLFGICLLLVIWQLAAHHYASDLLLPPPRKTLVALVQAVQKPEIINNLLITLRRVATGFIYAVVIGLPLGYLMGYSKAALKILEPIVSSLRQVPIMAWVPLTIVWFGLGDGPTVFLIAFSGVFPILLNTIAGVQSISQDYYNAARSMGAGPVSILLHIIVPGSLPDVLTGMRLGLGAGWMSVICAEFIATSAGFGFAMVEAQTRMQTDTLIALMIISALVGFTMDSGIRLFRRIVTRWQGVY
ncbi:MAG TPA: ABC transporter permease [Syntrophomonadaceae bacterium]|nr:ABC transporter permease [Syntrophomonadaceae bacterium]